MKKLGKSLSFLTKIMLVVGLLISNLSSLSIVFASEVTIDISVVDEKLNIKYLDELADEVETVKVNVYENYTYLDETYYEDEATSEKGRVSSYEISFKELDESVNTETVTDGTEMETDDVNSEVVVENTEESVVEEENATEIVNESVDVENTLETENAEFDNTVVENVETDEELTEDKEISLVVDSILSSIVFDGRYDVKVEIVDTTDVDNEEIIATYEYNMDVLHKSGLELNVVDAITGEKLELLDDGRYSIDYASPEVRVVARVLAGGFGPMDVLSYNGIDYFAKDLVELEFSSEMDFSGRLYGDYTVPVAVELEKYNRDTEEYELVEIPEEDLVLNVLYGTYDLNNVAMNTATEELTLDEYYVFDGDSKDGVVYVLLDETKINTMLDLYNIANYIFNEDEYITFDLSNSEYQNIISTYDETTAIMSLTDMLANINLDESVVLSLVNDGLTITYKVVVAGDANNDNLLTKEDLLDLVDQVLGNKDVNLEKSDLYGNDGDVNTLDVMYLDQVIKNDDWNVALMEDTDVSIDSELKVVETDIVSGQKFTVNYIVKLSDYAVNGIGGLFKYDDSALALESIDVVNEWLGNNKDGQFLYIGEESLALPVVEDTDSDVINSEIPETEENVTDVPVDEVAEDTNTELDDTLTEGEIANENTEDVIVTEDYVVVEAVFTALKSGTHTISVENLEYFNRLTYYGVEDTPVSVDVVVNASDNNNLSTLTVAGQEITLEEGKLDYEITVSNDVTVADVEAMVENVAANITSIVSPEELVEGENIVTITVTSESGDVKVYTVKVIREAAPEEETTTQVNYNNYYEADDEDDNDAEDNVVVTEPEEDTNEDDDKKVEEESNLSRIVIIILILLVIAGLIYLIFKDEDDDETKKTNKEINKLKKEVKEPEIKKEVKSDNKPNNKVNNKTNNKNSNNNKNKNSKNKKKDR